MCAAGPNAASVTYPTHSQVLALLLQSWQGLTPAYICSFRMPDDCCSSTLFSANPQSRPVWITLADAAIGDHQRRSLTLILCRGFQVIQEYENGKAIPAPAVLSKLSRVLGVQLSAKKK